MQPTELTTLLAVSLTPLLKDLLISAGVNETNLNILKLGAPTCPIKQLISFSCAD